MCCVSRHISDNWSVDGASFYFRANFWGCTLLGPLVWLLLSPNNPFAATVAFTFSVIVTILFVLFVIFWDRCFDRHEVYVIIIANLLVFSTDFRKWQYVGLLTKVQYVYLLVNNIFVFSPKSIRSIIDQSVATLFLVHLLLMMLQPFARQN